MRLEEKFALSSDEIDQAIQAKDSRLSPDKKYEYLGYSPAGGIYVVDESSGPSFFSVEFNLYEKIIINKEPLEFGNFVAITAVPIKLGYEEDNKTLKENKYENYILDKTYIYVAILPVENNDDLVEFTYKIKNTPVVEGLVLTYKGPTFQEVFYSYFS